MPGETGLLVPVDPVSATDFEPKDPARFAADLAAAINELIDHPDQLARMGKQARERVEHLFGWPSIARATLDFYRSLVEVRTK